MEIFQGVLLLTIYGLLVFYIIKSIIATDSKKALFLILVLGLLLRIFISTDLYLHEWDEKFHAVLSKNIFNSPIAPKLYLNPIIEYDFKDWSANHVWFSKPFLSFWILGLSIKIFGINELALRLPSILISLLSVYLSYKICKQLFNSKIALLTALLHAIHGNFLEFAGGVMSSDHVDNLFLFIFQLSIYYYFKYIKNKNPYLIWTIGVLIGLAFLTKWIMAIFIPLVIITHHFLKEKKLINTIYIVFQMLWPCILLILPYLIYILYRYPMEAGYTLSQILLPISRPIQEHSGNLLFYIDRVRIMFGELIYIPMIWLIYTYYKKKDTSYLFIIVWIFLPLILLSLCGTKRHTYIMMSAVPILILTAVFIEYLIINIKKFNYQKFAIIIISLLLLLPIRYSIERLKPFKLRLQYPEWRLSLEELNKITNNNNDKIAIYKEPHYLQAMFYYDNLAFSKMLTLEEINKIKAEGYVVFENVNGNYIPK
jgi:4-amino-4-deoxy-L-arabinose transferase